MTFGTRGKQNGKFGIDSMTCFNNIYQGKKVFITGHTGFKGSWLFRWLELIGADATGYALKPNTTPNHFSLMERSGTSTINDLRNTEQLEKAISSCQPEIVFHLAAQPLVRYSYANPVETYETNVIGTLNLLEACRKVTSVKAVVCVTTDKVYENHENPNGYRESDRLGGYDPYSSSKACTEILVSSYINSFLNHKEYGKSHQILVATARGGNVVGGGDWSEDRLIPDMIRSYSSNNKLVIRNPNSVRPWQHVLDCLSGYLLLGQNLLEGKLEKAKPWNFGPTEKEFVSVENIVQMGQKYLGSIPVEFGSSGLHETGMLQLNCENAISELGWLPILDNEQSFQLVFDWYKDFYDENRISTTTQLQEYISLAKQLNSVWIQ